MPKPYTSVLQQNTHFDTATLSAVLAAAIPEPERNALLSLLPYAELSLAAYVRKHRVSSLDHKPLQDGNDMIDLVCAETEALGFPEYARSLRRELEEHFHALTANHHGIDSHPEFFQADLLYGLGCDHCVPVFSGGTGYMTNDAYPRGVLLSRLRNLGRPADFVRIALLPKKPNCLMNLRPAYGKADLPIAFRPGASPAFTKLFARTLAEKHCTPKECDRIRDLLVTFFLDEQVLAQPTLRDQLSCINMHLWMRIAAKTSLPPVVCLDTAWLSRRLLVADLLDEHSLLRFHLDPSVLPDLYHALQGVQGCWTDRESLKGTFLFWGISPKKRMVSLYPDADWTHLVPAEPVFPALALSPSVLAEAVQEGRIVPSLLCEFLLTAMARGLRCMGGLFQYTYLPAMAKGVSEVAKKHGEQAIADRVLAESPFLAGLLPLRSKTGDAANGLDCLDGGLSDAVLGSLAQVSVGDALCVSLPYLADFLAEGEDAPHIASSVQDLAASAMKRMPWLEHGLCTPPKSVLEPEPENPYAE
ncbi:MAG: hypothetical protein IJU76_03390 [Desulfovibrionaceae bacterium]|nr:hypothetical protein [Desulfovibrionaceae bacterium]